VQANVDKAEKLLMVGYSLLLLNGGGVLTHTVVGSAAAQGFGDAVCLQCHCAVACLSNRQQCHHLLLRPVLLQHGLGSMPACTGRINRVGCF